MQGRVDEGSDEVRVGYWRGEQVYVTIWCRIVDLERFENMQIVLKLCSHKFW